MVYLTNGNHFRILLPALFIVLFTFGNKCQLYLSYILNLNYWLTNTIFILIIVSFFWLKLPPVTFIIMFFSVMKFTAVQDFLTQKQLISTLIVGTIAIHPLGFYVSTTIFILLFFYKFSKINLTLLQISYRNLSALLAITLVLGGFWGLQSITWGYFWVNDTIECLLLLKVVYVLFRLHNFIKKKITINNSLIPFFILNLIIMSRLNLLQTRHNFITSQPLIYYILCSYFFLCISIFLFFNRFKGNFVKSLINVFSVLILFLFFSQVDSLNIFKYILNIFVVYFLTSLHPKTFFKKFYLHITLLSFFIVWNFWFNFFSLHYKFNNNLNLYNIFCDKSLHLNTIYQTTKGFVYLEAVVFKVFYSTYNIITILHNLFFVVAMNNAKLFYFFLLIFLLKRVEFRFLY